MDAIKDIKGRVIILSGPSGSGKTTLYKTLLSRRKDLVKSVSVTTRPKRPGERNGRDYIFVTEKRFLYKKKSGHFLESEKVFDNYYGTPKKNVHGLLKQKKNVLLCIDVKGARTVCRKLPGAVKIFVKAPSLKILKKRLQERGSEDKKTVRVRLQTARFELREAKKYDYIIINNDLKQAYAKLSSAISAALK